MPRRADGTARVAKKVPQSLQADTDDDEFDTDYVEDDEVRPARPQ